MRKTPRSQHDRPLVPVASRDPGYPRLVAAWRALAGLGPLVLAPGLAHGDITPPTTVTPTDANHHAAPPPGATPPRDPKKLDPTLRRVPLDVPPLPGARAVVVPPVPPAPPKKAPAPAPQPVPRVPHIDLHVDGGIARVLPPAIDDAVVRVLLGGGAAHEEGHVLVLHPHELHEPCLGSGHAADASRKTT